jgi:uncharacterized NAD(P)/FAD-binding protein YdhS
VQLVRACERPIAVEIVEPRAEVGRGMAYTAPDPDWRLNGGSDTHVLDLADQTTLNAWCAAHGIIERDPEAVSDNGYTFVRRHDFGSFVRDQVASHARLPNGSTIRHVRDVAIDADVADGSVKVQLRSGGSIEADLLVIATGNAPPRLPASLSHLAGDPRVIVEALDVQRLRAIPLDASVLLLGSSLTALDVASTLVRRGQGGRIVSISRRGQRPRPHRAAPATPGPAFLERVEGSVPDFVRAAGSPPTVRGLVRAVRKRIREDEIAGVNWYAGFDAMRDVLWQVWPTLAVAEKRRALRLLRPWYDVHRFRTPPQNDALVRAAEAKGAIEFRAGRVRGIEARDGGLHVRMDLRGGGGSRERFDYVVNCTGLDPASGARDNPFLTALLQRGVITVDPSGIGFAVDSRCRPLDRDGRAQPDMRIFGPPSAGTFGDPLGVLFIAPQIRRQVPAMLEQLMGSDSISRNSGT